MQSVLIPVDGSACALRAVDLVLAKRARYRHPDELATRVRQLRSQVLVFARAHFQKCHYNSASCSGVAGFSIPKA